MDLVKFVLFTATICPLLVIQHQARAAPMCKDLNSKCSDYDATYCTRYDTIKKQCPLTCNQCGSVHPSSPVTPMTSSHLVDATQSTVVVSQSLTPTQSTGSIFQVTSVSQSLTPKQSTGSISQVTSVSQSLTPTQSTGSISQVTSVSQGLTPTQGTVSESQALTQTQSSVVLSQGFLKSPPTQNTDMVHNNIKTQNLSKATASKTDLTQASFLITLGILWSYLIYWC